MFTNFTAVAERGAGIKSRESTAAVGGRARTPRAALVINVLETASDGAGPLQAVRAVASTHQSREERPSHGEAYSSTKVIAWLKRSALGSLLWRPSGVESRPKSATRARPLVHGRGASTSARRTRVHVLSLGQARLVAVGRSCTRALSAILEDAHVMRHSRVALGTGRAPRGPPSLFSRAHCEVPGGAASCANLELYLRSAAATARR
jgi:hypothetical protein